MARAEFFDLHFGHSRWLRVAWRMVACLGLLAIFTASTHWAWKTGCAGLLVLIHLVADYRAGGARYSGTLRLFLDSTAVLRSRDGQETFAFQAGHAWVSRWISVVPLREPDNGARRYCLICASENRPDTYRRLMQWLRMRATTSEVQKMIC